MKNMFICKTAKRIALSLLTALLVTAANAMPAKPGLKQLLTLADGTTVSAQLVGDEHGHYWLSDDGKAYQEISNSNIFQLTDRQVIDQKARERRQKANHRRANRMPMRNQVNNYGDYTGDKKGLVILVNFTDVSLKSTHDNAFFQRFANEENYTEGSFKGSVHDYFFAQSGGKFNLTFDVVGPVKVSKKASYYGSNNSMGDDKHPAEMVIEALKMIDDEVNFADYDWNDDGEVDQVFIIYAGKGEADGGASNTIWPHEWNLAEASWYGDGTGVQVMDDVAISTYACGSELSASGSANGIGTMCHEFSHCLGFPDFYDTDYSGGKGMGEWDPMDSGSYNGNGFRPAGYTSYERWMAGWQEPIELTNTKRVEGMKALQNGGEAYIIYNKGNRNEYFLLENRQKTAWDTNVPSRGMLIIHVDYDEYCWVNNLVNDIPNHQRMTWVAADDDYSYWSYGTDTYPNGTVNAFGPNTTPAAKLYNKNADGTKYLDSSVEEIKQNSDGTISFIFRGISNVSTPYFTPKPGRYEEPQTVTISCDTEGAVIYYTLDGTTPSVNSSVYTEPFVVSEDTTVKAIAMKDDEESLMAKAAYFIGVTPSNPDAVNFKMVESVDEIQLGMRYIICRDDKAAGDMSNQVLSKVNVETADDIIIINDDVAVFIVEQTNGGWSLMNEATGKYLSCTDTKKLAYVDEPDAWKLNTDNGVTMTYGSYGTMLYNVNSPRFTTYTSSPNASMLPAHLYMETEEGPVHKNDVTMAFSTDKVVITLGDEFAEPTLTTTPADLPVTYSSSNASVATIDAETGKVSIKGIGVTEIIAYYAGDEVYNEGSASYIIKVKHPGGLAEEGSFELVTDASVLDAGQQVMLAVMHNDELLVMSTTQNANNRAATKDFTVNNDDTLVPGEEAQVIMLERDGDFFHLNVETGYLYAASSNSNWLRTEDVPDSNAKAAISIDTEGMATIVFQGSSTHNHLRFNPNNGKPMFSCYDANSSIKSLPMIYRLVAGNPTTGITTMKQEQAAAAVYNLQGQRVSSQQRKGIYIVNGRKVMK